MKAKRAEITLENTLTVILAVLGLILLFAGAYKLYQVIVNQEQENAKNFLNVVEAKINALQDRETGMFSIRGIKSDSKWFLTGWSKDDPDRALDKIECFLESCICICNGNTGKLSEICTNKGYCKKIENKRINIISSIYMESSGGTNIIGGLTPIPGNSYSGYVKVNYIILPKNLVTLQINKTAPEITITGVS